MQIVQHGYFENNDWGCELCSDYLKKCTKCINYHYCLECEDGSLLLESLQKFAMPIAIIAENLKIVLNAQKLIP